MPALILPWRKPLTFLAKKEVETPVRNELLMSFYGDDFTGSTDVMETLALNGIPTALFLQPPTRQEVSGFVLKHQLGGDKLRAFGIAGIARSLSPGKMEDELHTAFQALQKIPTDFVQYKVCSTLDSAPHVGNIGTATDVACQYFPSRKIPMVVGAPFLNRYVVFSNLFARIGRETFRLDRHPVMSHHPITPMRESDIRRHLGDQTPRAFATIDLHDLSLDDHLLTKRYTEEGSESGSFLLFDTLTYDHLDSIGRLIYEGWQGKTQLLVASSGLSYALARHVRLKESIVVQAEEDLKAGRASSVLAAVGSCSPVTAGQMAYAASHGFTLKKLDVRACVEGDDNLLEALSDWAAAKIQAGMSPMIYTAKGPDDPDIKIVQSILGDKVGSYIGSLIGRFVHRTLKQTGPVRVVIGGGDTSGYVARHLQIYALETLCPIAPGAPLCVAHARDSLFDGLEIALKGGQNGKEDYFTCILEGSSLNR